ncbi:response regulator transcription factor [Skermanella mucosa]|uniref:Response regulator transcription factor n=1 Tax=Skermanella cutis TaxID=2775420 RepID=A0ABX7B4M2_9PROT|nr:MULTISPECIES: response regulator transcription factor [Skermanella]QQP88065.1 response regulator transcription factor [Skermanella sp. TT6]UEM22567.1 response regulator transcription factor [Skermanella mucosa]
MKILIGDDHLLFREGLRRLLEQLSADATFTDASTFDEVLELVQNGGDTFDLILIDLQMPGWPGFSGLEQVCTEASDTPVVVVSASENQADVRSSLDAGAAGFIPKSSSVKIMLSALNLVFSGGIYLPPSAIHADVAAKATPIKVETEHGGDRGSNHHQLTQRQWEVLNCLREGKSNKQIAYELGLSEGTVKIHVTAIFKSLGVKNRTQAVIVASELQR